MPATTTTIEPARVPHSHGDVHPMTHPVLRVSLALALLAPLAVAAQSTPPAHAHSHGAPSHGVDPAADVPVEAQAAVAVVDRLGDALAAGDLEAVEGLLAPDVLILESGGAEHSRAQYMGHHAISDSRFLRGSHRQVIRRRAAVEGALAWVGTESELHARKDGQALTLLSTETMVLRNTADGWRIVHIHWSSRPKKT